MPTPTRRGRHILLDMLCRFQCRRCCRHRRRRGRRRHVDISVVCIRAARPSDAAAATAQLTADILVIAVIYD